jgi:hypothetical protein
MTILGEGRMIRHGIFKTRPTEPAIGQIQVDFFPQAALRTDAEALADDQHPDHQFRINGWPARVTAVFGEMLAKVGSVEMLVDAAKEMILWDVVVKVEGVEKSSLLAPLNPIMARLPACSDSGYLIIPPPRIRVFFNRTDTKRNFDFPESRTSTLLLTGARKEAKPTEPRPVEPRVRPDRVRYRA